MVVALALPIALGPALSTVTRLLAGPPVHVCMCGMKRGTCGCPECQALETERRAARHVHRFAIVHRTCDDDDGVAVAPALPAFVGPPDGVAVTPPPAARTAPTTVAALRSQLTREPSTPPPRA
jgi:hypothetical protein